jgi:hypothetical protein
MAERRVGFTPGSHIQFGSLDFFLHGGGSRPGLAPPFVPIHHASLLSFDERVGDLDPIGVEGRAPHHPLLSHSVHLPTSTPSPSQ